MAKSSQKVLARLRRKKSIRKKLSGTELRPRMSVYRSNKHIYVQVIDDAQGKTVTSVSTLSPELRDEVAGLKKVDAAAKVGEFAAKRCADKKVEQVVFDRNGFAYIGRVAALADAARKSGLRF